MIKVIYRDQVNAKEKRPVFRKQKRCRDIYFKTYAIQLQKKFLHFQTFVNQVYKWPQVSVKMILVFVLKEKANIVVF